MKESAILSIIYIVWMISLSFAAPRKNLRIAEVQLVLSESRSGMEDLKLSISGDGMTKNLRMTKMNNPWIKNGILMKVSQGDLGESIVEEITMKNHMNIYKDVENDAIIGIRDGKVHGIIDDKTTLVSENGKYYLHEKLETNLNKHIDINLIHDVKRLPLDYIDISADENMVVNKKIIDIANSDPESRMNEYTVELLIIVDSTLSDKFGTDEELGDYLSIYCNGVQSRFDNIATAKFTIKLVAAMRIVSAVDEEFITSTHISNNEFDGNKLLENLVSFIATSPVNTVKFDLACLLTGREIVDDTLGSSIAGRAYLDAACKSVKVSWVEDNGDYSGVQTGTHEIGHNLGSPHDPVNGTDTDCYWNLGHIMAYEFPSANKHIFSRCSTESMISFADTAECLQSNDFVRDEPCRFNVVQSETLPGERLNMDEQCVKLTGNADSIKLASTYDNKEIVCQILYCKLETGTSYTSYGNPPLQHSVCDTNKWCDDGKCVTRP